MAKKTRRIKTSKKASKKTGRSHAAATDAKGIQAQVRDFTLETISKRNLSLDHLSDLASAVLGSATTAMKNVVPASRKNALRQVLNGIDDAWAATAKASVSSLRHAQQYGLRFAQRDLTQLGKRLGSLEKEFIKTVDLHARRLGGDLEDELNNLSGQIRRAGTRVKPAAEAARKAITGKGATIAKEVAEAGAKAGKQALRGALLTASGFLEGAGKALKSTATRGPRSK